MAHTFNWQLGHEGKGNVYEDGSISTWNTTNDEPHHIEKGYEDEKRPRFHFYISPEGGLWEGGLGFSNRTPYSDDQVVADIVAQHPAVYDARHELGNEDVGSPEERVEIPGGGFGHAEHLMLSKLASSGWADFHTEFKIPRGIRKQIRRWVDRLKWPEGSEKMDAREYHITVLDMDKYDEDFAKWAKKRVEGKTLVFKSQSMDLFNEFVVVRLECPVWDEIAKDWTEEAERRGLEPHIFPGGPKAHISVGKSPNKKWPQGIPNPHIKFETRMFNINRNSVWHEITKESMAINPNYLNTYMEENGPYMFHGARPRRGGDPEQVARSIEHKGIVPQGDEREFEEYPGYPGEDLSLDDEHDLREWWLRPRPGHTYMTAHPEDAYGEPMFRIDLRKLDPQKIKADEDLMDEEGYPSFGPYSNPATEGDPRTLGEQAQEVRWGNDPEQTRQSLETRGTLAYEGTIPAEAIERYHYQPQEEGINDPRDDSKSPAYDPSADIPLPGPGQRESKHGFFYHVVPREHREAIEREGLKPSLESPVSPWANATWDRSQQPSGVYLWDDPANARGYAYTLEGLAGGGEFPGDRGGGIYETPDFERYMDEYPGEPEGMSKEQAEENYDNYLDQYEPQPLYDVWKVNTLGLQPQIDPEMAIENGELTAEQAQQQINEEATRDYKGELQEYNPWDITRSEGHRWYVPHGIEPGRLTLHDSIYPEEMTMRDRDQGLEETRQIPDAWHQVPLNQWSEKARNRYLGDPRVMREIDPQDRTSANETTPNEDLKAWLDSFTVEQPSPPSLHHTDGDKFAPQIVAPVVESPHIDPPSKPYKPYDWAKEGWEEDPLDRVAAIDTHICPKCGEDSNSPICATCGHDPRNSPDDYQQMKNDWYDRAWSVPGNQPRPVPNQPMHWRDDYAKNVSLAHTNQDNSKELGGWRGF